MAQLETTIDAIRVTVASSKQTIILKQKQAERYLPIWINSRQANIVKSEIVESNKNIFINPFLNSIDAGGYKIKSVIVLLKNNIFHTNLTLFRRDESYDVDCPIGVALALGIRDGVPILVDEAVFDQAGLTVPT